MRLHADSFVRFQLTLFDIAWLVDRNGIPPVHIGYMQPPYGTRWIGLLRPFKLGDPGDQMYLIPSNFCDCHFFIGFDV